MTVQNMWPLAFLFVIPVIILLYILKQKVKDEPFSSIMLWQEIYKNLEAKTPFEKLKQNLLMYLQIFLMLLLIFALMAPMLKNGGELQENIVIVIDNSASMQYIYEGNQTRLDYSVKRAEQEIDGFSENSTVTLITCNADASVVYQGKDKSTLKRRLKEINPTMLSGNLNVASNVINSLVNNMQNVQIICYTDTEFAREDWTKGNEEVTMVIEDVFSEGENTSLDYVNYTVEEDDVEILCKISNRGTLDVTQDVSLYINTEIADVQEVTVKAGESANVYFEKQKIETDGSVVISAELSDRDSLIADNRQSTVVTENVEKKILLLSAGNVFMEKALALEEKVEVYKSSDSSVLDQAVEESDESFDLYVFDGIALSPEYDFSRFPSDANFLLLNSSSDFGESGYISKEKELKNTILTFKNSAITEYLEDFSFGITKAYTYELPEWGIPFLADENGGVVGYYGTIDQHNVTVLGMDIHNTDFALQTEFPIFMSQLCNWLLGSTAEEIVVDNFPTNEESEVIPVDSVVIEGSKDYKKTGGRAIRNLILLFAILLLAVEWIVYVVQVNSNKKKQYFIVRLLVLLTIVLAMAGVSVTQKQKKAETIFLVDASDSMAGNRKELETYLEQTLSQMPDKNLGGIVVFGKDTAVDSFLSDKKVFSGFTAEPVTTATNIEKAVTTACSMFDEGVTRRLVLITDGSENEGSMNLAAMTLKGREVELYTIAVEDSISGNQEVYIDELEVPSVIHLGDHYNVMVSVVSNVETDAVLSLFSGRIAKGQQNIHISKGRNQFVFEDIGEEGTIAQYKAVIEPEKDTISINNTYVTFSQIEARPRVLVVEGKSSEAKEFGKILQAANVDYDIVTPKGVPVSLSELNQYKAIVTLNVHYDDLRNGFPSVLDSYVKDFAGGYVCIGGDNSYALGGYRGTELEQMLPVYMDLQGEKEIPKMSMAFVIDQSGSMTTPSEESTSVTGLDLAKQAAVSGVSEVRSTDEVGVLAFDDSFHWIVPIQEVTDLETLKENIKSIGYGGGTSIYPALQEAYLKMIKSNAKIKHIILLTDGQDGYNQYDSLLKLINAAGITVSTVAVGSDSDQKTLSYIAEQCGGRYYYTDVNNSIPRIFAQEVYLSTKTYLINEEFSPVITSNNALLDGVMDDGCPLLMGYVAATPKPAADVLLESHKEDPILTTWQYGLGRTIAWNSDGNNQWTAQYATWENYPMLWSNIINYVISDTELGDDRLELVKEGNTSIITYETKAYNQDTIVEAVITEENGATKEVALEPIKPGVFEASMDMDEIGVYNVSIRKKDGQKILKNYNTAYANQYSVEYQFVDGKTDLATFTKQAGGVEITMQEDVWKLEQQAVKAKISLTIPLLIISLLLFLFDVVVRRFSFDIWSFVRKMTGFLWQKLKKRVKKKNQKVVGLKETAQSEEVEDFQSNITIQKESKVRHTRFAEHPRKKKENKTKEKPENRTEKLDMNMLLKKKNERNN